MQRDFFGRPPQGIDGDVPAVHHDARASLRVERVGEKQEKNSNKARKNDVKPLLPEGVPHEIPVDEPHDRRDREKTQDLCDNPSGIFLLSHLKRHFVTSL